MALSKITNLSITDDAVRTVGIQDAAVTTAKTSGVPTLFLPTANPLIINGDMAVAQRGTSVTGASSSGYKAIDRYRHTISIGTWTITQSTDSPSDEGFGYSMKMDCTTAEASPGSTDALAFSQKIEGQNLQLIKKGTSNAEKLTLAFWVKCTKTGTACVNLYDVDNNRMTGQQFTVDATDTWEKKILTFAGDTTGALGNDNGDSLRCEIWLDAGSAYKTGATPTSWETLNTADYFAGCDLDLGDSTSNDIYITGLQLESGEYTSSTIPPFRHESYGDNLRRCQRYYETQTGFYWFGFQSGTNVTHDAMASCKVEKRDTPSGTYSGSVVNYYPNTGGGNDETNNITAITIGDKNGSTFVGMQTEADAPTDAGYWPVYADARNAVLNWDAEL